MPLDCPPIPLTLPFHLDPYMLVIRLSHLEKTEHSFTRQKVWVKKDSGGVNNVKALFLCAYLRKFNIFSEVYFNFR